MHVVDHMMSHLQLRCSYKNILLAAGIFLGGHFAPKNDLAP